MSNERREKDELRRASAQLDGEILTLLRKRARLSKEWAAAQAIARAPRLPTDERDALEALVKASEGEVPAPAVIAVFREIHALSRAIETPVRIAVCGPEGGHGYLVAREQFGALAQILVADAPSATLDLVSRGRADFAVLPYETADRGVEFDTLLALREADLKVVALPDATRALALYSATGNAREVEKIYATASDRALAYDYVTEHLPTAVTVDVKSPLVAAQLASEERGAGALALEGVGERAGLAIAERSVAEHAASGIRYCVASPRPASRTGRDATAVVFTVSDEPGALFEVLKHFAERGVNLRKIQSRATGVDWEYLFYAEVSGHATDRGVVTALEDSKKNTKSFKVLGSFAV